jgi:hypothetical protein
MRAPRYEVGAGTRHGWAKGACRWWHASERCFASSGLPCIHNGAVNEGPKVLHVNRNGLMLNKDAVMDVVADFMLKVMKVGDSSSPTTLEPPPPTASYLVVSGLFVISQSCQRDGDGRDVSVGD